MEGFKFDPQMLERLNDPERLKDIPPQWIWDKLDVREASTVVDLGAGTGFFSKQFTAMPGVEKVYALDISEKMIEYMRTGVNPQYPQVIPMIMDESSIPLPAGMADVVIMINLHHEFHEPHTILAECSRILKPEGRMAIVDWAKKETEHGPPLEKRYTAEAVLEQLETKSFQNIRTYHTLPNHFLITAENGK